MNNRIMATLFALAIALFIGVVPVKAEAAECAHVHDANCGYVECTCRNASYHQNQVAANACAGVYGEGVACKFEDYNGKCEDRDNTYKCDACYRHMHKLTKYEAKEATCNEAGNKEYYVCGDSTCQKNFLDAAGTQAVSKWDVDVEIPAKGHDMEWIPTEDTHVHSCKNCGYATTAENHSYGERVDNQDGTHSATCTDCGYVKTVEHFDNGTKDCLCDSCNAQLEHTLTDWYAYPSNLEEEHIKYCTTCQTTIEKEVHVFESYVPNDYGTNTHQVECTICGYENATAPCTDDDKDHVCDDCGGFLNHQADLLKSTYKWPTCEESGEWQHQYCEGCDILLRDGKLVTREELFRPAIGHTPNGKWEKDDAAGHYQWCANDCGTKLLMADHEDTDGWAVYPSNDDKHFHQCNVCYRTMETEDHQYTYVDIREQWHEPVCEICGHKDEWVDHKDTDGDGDCLCDDCGHAMAHTDTTKMTYVEAKPATCEEDGHTDYYLCEECGGTFLSDGSAWDPELKALGHDWKFVANTSGILGDVKHRVECGNCKAYEVIGHTDEDGDCLCDIGSCVTPVHSHKHVYVGDVAPTCEQPGTKGYYYYEGCGRMFMNGVEIDAPEEIPATGHTAGTEYEAVDGDMHAIKCETCGEAIAEEAHADANNDNRCDVCNVELALEIMARQEPTCTQIGYEQCWISRVTGRMYADENGNVHITSRKEIPATGHTWGSSDSTGTCHVCDDCGASAGHVNRNGDCICDICELFDTNHTATFVAEVASTCTKTGTKAYVVCSCGTLYDAITGDEISAPAVIPAKGHVMGKEVKKDVQEGDHYIQCTVCDYELHENHVMAVEDPLKGNYHQWVCACGEVETAKHSDSDGDNKCDECKHVMNSTAPEVEQHDSKTVITGNPETIKPQKSWWKNWLSNLTPGNADGSDATKGAAPEASEAPQAPTTGGNASGTGSNAGTSNAPSTNNGNAINELINWLNQLINMLKNAF